MNSNHKTSFVNVPRVRLGDYITRSTENNRNLKYGIELIEGVTNEGVFAAPKGNPLDVDLKPYKIVNNGAFVYNPSRLNLGSIAYRTDGMCIVSHLYIVFYLNDIGKKKIDPDWLFMYFRREEFYREVTFRNFGSQRPEFNFNDISDITIPLPDISIQRQYVAIYKSMVANQQSYERGLEDLKLVCEGYIDKLKACLPHERIGEYIALYTAVVADRHGLCTALGLHPVGQPLRSLAHHINIHAVRARPEDAAQPGRTELQRYRETLLDLIVTAFDFH